MRRLLPALLAVMMPVVFSPSFSQDAPKGLSERIDSIVSGAYQSAVSQFPCKVKSSGKIHMIRWQEVDRCLNDASERVDWAAISGQLEALRAANEKVSKLEFVAAVEASLSAHALPFDKVFLVKDDRSLLPLTNSLLRFLPPDSLHDLPVFDRAGTSVGMFSGVYTFERTGGLASANTYKLTLFQYTDTKGNVQAAADKLLLDSFGVPWKAAGGQRGFRLTMEKVILKK